MACTVSDIAGIMERWAPVALAEEGDNVGLLAGRADRAVDGVLIALDVDDAVLDCAKQMGMSMVIAHHPFLYRKVSAVSDDTRVGRLALAAIEAGIALYAAHTNLDRAPGGVNDALCEAVCLAGAAPAWEGSIARLARLAGPVTLNGFALQVKAALGAPSVRVAGPTGQPLNTVYVISGAGRHDIADAARLGADCMLTGEIGYHDAQEALGYGLSVVEAGHYWSEAPVLRHIEKHLQNQFQQLQYTVRTAVYKKTTCPFYYPV